MVEKFNKKNLLPIAKLTQANSHISGFIYRIETLSIVSTSSMPSIIQLASLDYVKCFLRRITIWMANILRKLLRWAIRMTRFGWNNLEIPKLSRLRIERISTNLAILLNSRKWLLILKNLNIKMPNCVYQFTVNHAKNGQNLPNGLSMAMFTRTISAGLFKFHVYSEFHHQNWSFSVQIVKI